MESMAMLRWLALAAMFQSLMTVASLKSCQVPCCWAALPRPELSEKIWSGSFVWNVELQLWQFQSATPRMMCPTAGPRGGGSTLPGDTNPRSALTLTLTLTLTLQRHEALTVRPHLHSHRQRDYAQEQGWNYSLHSAVIRQKIFPGSFSTLVVSFHLQRHMGDFVIQVSKTCQ